MTPTTRTLAECKRRGWIAQVVEQTIPRTFIKRDLFGVIDIIAVGPGDACCTYGRSLWPMRFGQRVCPGCNQVSRPYAGAILGIQVTSGSNHAARIAKAKAEPRLQCWLSAGGRFEVWSWSKRGARGKRKTWTLRIEEVTP